VKELVLNSISLQLSILVTDLYISHAKKRGQEAKRGKKTIDGLQLTVNRFS